jgi:uncharacterized C2H2 Zn-finger protein
MEPPIMNKNLSTLAVLAVAAFLASTQSALATYKWVDDEGNVHYSQLPPAGQTVEKLKAPTKVDTERAQKDLGRIQKKSDSYLEERAKQKGERLKAETESAAKKSRCASARNELDGVVAHYRVFVTNEAGERVRQSEEQRQARESAALEKIDTNCS